MMGKTTYQLVHDFFHSIIDHWIAGLFVPNRGFASKKAETFPGADYTTTVEVGLPDKNPTAAMGPQPPGGLVRWFLVLGFLMLVSGGLYIPFLLGVPG